MMSVMNVVAAAVAARWLIRTKGLLVGRRVPQRARKPEPSQMSHCEMVNPAAMKEKALEIAVASAQRDRRTRRYSPIMIKSKKSVTATGAIANKMSAVVVVMKKGEFLRLGSSSVPVPIAQKLMTIVFLSKAGL